MIRRDWLKLLLAAPIAATVDVEKLLWVPKPIVTVPAMPLAFHPKAFEMVMESLKVGDIFTIEGRFRVNPVTKTADRRTLQQWIVVSS